VKEDERRIVKKGRNAKKKTDMGPKGVQGKR